uniref:Uncharacterized protein n=1 Tax=Nelumbo nucifera TaxID=4432 RepID=A0A822Z035_NELNU|nr:TPA_asm: hypothetical protein HUJ06_005468 [Nelumbo nucifera]
MGEALMLLSILGFLGTRSGKEIILLSMGQWKRASDFVDAKHNCWREEELRNVFGEDRCRAVMHIKLSEVVENSEDLLVWFKDPHGFLTTMARYCALRLLEA